MTDAASDVPSLFTLTSLFSLSAVLAIVSLAVGASKTLLPQNATTKLRLLFVWHAFDFMLHSTIEAGWLYHVFNSWAPRPATPAAAAAAPYVTTVMTPPDVYFLGHPDRLYGSYYASPSAPFAALWREYAKADHRAGGADLTTVCMELLCVFVMGPLALYTCILLRKGLSAQAWFCMIFIATSELYGNFMTFAPEWLTGCPSLNTSVFMYKWLYLLFFNAGLWVLIPAWVLWEAYHALDAAFSDARRATVRFAEKSKVKD